MMCIDGETDADDPDSTDNDSSISHEQLFIWLLLYISTTLLLSLADGVKDSCFLAISKCLSIPAEEGEEISNNNTSICSSNRFQFNAFFLPTCVTVWPRD